MGSLALRFETDTPFQGVMGIGAVGGASLVAMERASAAVGASAGRIASGDADMAKEVVALGQAQVQAEIAVKVAKTVDQTIGTLLDIVI